MRHAGPIALALCCAASLAAGGSSRAGSPVPEPVQRAAAYYASSMTGVVVEERHVTFEASAGPAHFSQSNDAMVMLQDGEYKRLRYLRIVENGKSLSPDQVAQRESENNADLEQGKTFFKQPFDGKYARDYTFAESACASCASGQHQFEFTSLVRDEQHGDGTMVIDASGRVMSLTYTPNVFPKRASSGTTTETFGEAAPGLWTILSIQHDYSGRVAFIKGNGTLIERMDHFQRFTNTVAGIRYLQRASL